MARTWRRMVAVYAPAWSAVVIALGVAKAASAQELTPGERRLMVGAMLGQSAMMLGDSTPVDRCSVWLISGRDPGFEVVLPEPARRRLVGSAAPGCQPPVYPPAKLLVVDSVVSIGVERMVFAHIAGGCMSYSVRYRMHPNAFILEYTTGDFTMTCDKKTPLLDGPNAAAILNVVLKARNRELAGSWQIDGCGLASALARPERDAQALLDTAHRRRVVFGTTADGTCQPKAPASDSTWQLRVVSVVPSADGAIVTLNVQAKTFGRLEHYTLSRWFPAPGTARGQDHDNWTIESILIDHLSTGTSKIPFMKPPGASR